MGKFKFIETGIKDMFVIEPTAFGDSRGYFMETYNKNEFFEAGLNYEFVQDNQSKSTKGVLRGLHFQRNYPQGKLVRVLKGEVYDVGVDLRKNSPTFKKWCGIMLSEDNRKMLYVPPGFAHGFVVVSDEAEFSYKCTDFYHPEDEGGIIWNDPCLGIDWPLELLGDVKLSDKDKKLPSLDEVLKTINY